MDVGVRWRGGWRGEPPLWHFARHPPPYQSGSFPPPCPLAAALLEPQRPDLWREKAIRDFFTASQRRNFLRRAKKLFALGEAEAFIYGVRLY